MVYRNLIYAIYRVAFEDKGVTDPKANLELRIKLQKLAYLVQELLGVRLGLNFSMYLYGPYAPALSDVYYEDDFTSKVPDARVPHQIEAVDDKIKKLSKKDARWLEVAATFYSMRKRAKNDDDAIISVTKIKPVTYEEVKMVVEGASEILGT